MLTNGLVAPFGSYPGIFVPRTDSVEPENETQSKIQGSFSYSEYFECNYVLLIALFSLQRFGSTTSFLRWSVRIHFTNLYHVSSIQYSPRKVR